MGRRTRERLIAEFRKLVGLPEGSTRSLPDRKHREARDVADEEEGTRLKSSGRQPRTSVGATWKGYID